MQEELKVIKPSRRTTAQIIEKLIGSSVDKCKNCGSIGKFVTLGIESNINWIFDNCKNISQRGRPPPMLKSKSKHSNPLLANI